MQKGGPLQQLQPDEKAIGSHVRPILNESSSAHLFDQWLSGSNDFENRNKSIKFIKQVAMTDYWYDDKRFSFNRQLNYRLVE